MRGGGDSTDDSDSGSDTPPADWDVDGEAEMDNMAADDSSTKSRQSEAPPRVEAKEQYKQAKTSLQTG